MAGRGCQHPAELLRRQEVWIWHATPEWDERRIRQPSHHRQRALPQLHWPGHELLRGTFEWRQDTLAAPERPEKRRRGMTLIRPTSTR